MHVVPFDQAPLYEAPGHHGMVMRRIQGRDAGPSDTVWMGVSVIDPGGGTTLTAAEVEKFYVVLDGELEVVATSAAAQRTALLRSHDSCRIAPGEARQLRNPTDRPCTVLLVMPHR
jgi:mannose-6-phosphate isomerase-like protein (cupin superfamily)